MHVRQVIPWQFQFLTKTYTHTLTSMLMPCQLQFLTNAYTLACPCPIYASTGRETVIVLVDTRNLGVLSMGWVEQCSFELSFGLYSVQTSHAKPLIISSVRWYCGTPLLRPPWKAQVLLKDEGGGFLCEEFIDKPGNTKVKISRENRSYRFS